MKLKSELYLYETMFMLEGLNLKAEQLCSLLRFEKRKAHIASFFAPWASSSIWTALSIKADIIMQQMNMLSELREKIMLSEGQDDDMQPITLQEIIDNYQDSIHSTQ
jgi:hypothetical protein